MTARRVDQALLGVEASMTRVVVVHHAKDLVPEALVRARGL